MEKEFKSNFLTRSITAILLILPIVGIIYFENIYILLTSVFLLIYASNTEWLKNSNNQILFGKALFLILLFSYLFASLNLIQLTILISVLFWLIFSAYLVLGKTSKLSLVSFDNFYIRLLILLSFCSCSLYLMKVSDIFVFSNFILFFILIINSAISDSSAYLVGSSIGKTPLFPDISPNKSLEGFLGGLGGCFLFGFGIYYIFETPASFIAVLVIGSFFAFVGDYFFSFLKRKSGIKDTGNILPGHGGLLDRIDSHLSSFPVLILLIILLYS